MLAGTGKEKRHLAVFHGYGPELRVSDVVRLGCASDSAGYSAPAESLAAVAGAPRPTPPALPMHKARKAHKAHTTNRPQEATYETRAPQTRLPQHLNVLRERAEAVNSTAAKIRRNFGRDPVACTRTRSW